MWQRYGALLAVAGGGAIGSLTRWGAQSLVPDGQVDRVTLGLNVAGSLLVGVLVAHRLRISDGWYQLVATGFAGGLTTFSTFAVAVASRLEDGALLDALGYSLSTVVAALLAAGIGYRLGRLVRWPATRRRT